ncbi:MAG: hypothetical protein HOW73_50755 [Polyangiaceae bacterium]|nr:hypothetical protein [Polyangiaceae bacterium]
MVAFPPPSSITDEDTIIVRGTASVDGDVNSVSVAGVDATSSDGFTNWQAAVPLSLGTQMLSVDAVVDGEPVNVASVEVDRRSSLMTEPVLLAVDVEGGRAFTATAGIGEVTVVYEIDLASGTQTVVSSEAVGSGPSFQDDFYTLSWDPNGQRILAFDYAGLWSIDPDTGARTILHANPAGPDPWPGDDNGAVVDAANNRIIFTTDSLNDWVAAIDLSTFATTRLASNNSNGPPAGSGPELDGDQNGIALDTTNDRLIIAANGFENFVYAIDLTTLERSVLASPSIGSGPWLPYPSRLTMNDGTAWIADNVGPTVIAVDLLTGNRTLISSQLVGSGSPTLGLTSLGHDGQRLLATDYALDALVEIDGTTGERSLVSSFAIGDGPHPLAPNALAWDDVNGRALAIDGRYEGLMSIDTVHGDRALLSSSLLQIGEGPSMFQAADLVAVNGAAIAVASTNITRIDFATGDRTTISNADVGGGPNFSSLAGVATSDDQPSDLWAVDLDGTVFHVDPTSGDRTAVSDAVTGDGPIFTTARDIVYDADNDRLVVTAATADSAGVFAVDPATGDRVELSGSNVGRGPTLVLVGQTTLEGDALFVSGAEYWFRVDLATGERLQISNPDSAGPGLSMQGATVDATHGWLLSTDLYMGSLTATDRVTGERVVLSR